MNTQELFGSAARWTSYKFDDGLPLVRKEFEVKDIKSASLTICGLGYFEVYINGRKVSNAHLLPVFSDYGDRDFGHMGYPLKDKTSNRIYVVRFDDVKEYINDGRNAIVVLLCPGFFAKRNRIPEGNASFSDKLLLCYTLKIHDKNGIKEIVSDKNLKFSASHIKKWNLYMGVVTDFKCLNKEAYLSGFDDSGWQNAKETDDPDVPLYIQDCPADCITKTLVPKVIWKFGSHVLYDAGKNISGFATFVGKGKVKVTYAEEIKQGIFLDFENSGGRNQKQCDVFCNMSEGDMPIPNFRWNGFRYFRIDGKAKDVKVQILHIPFEESATFNCDNEVLNKLFDAYKLTQLNNMHAGVPSDCPHRERLGYTGDGQLTTETALMCFNAEAFYRKWINDICDCQDINSGHVQHTAPFMGGGGGPCGWGGAIVLAPYKYYMMTGDIDFVGKIIPYMEKWFEFIKNDTFGKGKEYGLVVRERPKGWCLGDWCTLDEIKIPEAFVNTYYLIVCLECYAKLCSAGGREARFMDLISICKKAIIENFQGKDGFFCKSIQGADFFACDIGLIPWEKLDRQVENYRKLKRFDTGIFGTDVLLKVLCENGESELACELLSSENLGSFGYMFNNGGTTLWEYWRNKKSHDHPMFGAAVKYLYTGIAGIEYDAGLRNIKVYPHMFPKMLSRLNCSLNKNGINLSVEYNRIGNKLRLSIVSSGNANVYVVTKGGKKTLLKANEDDIKREVFIY